MILYKVECDDWYFIMTKSNWFPNKNKKRFVKWFNFTENKRANKWEKKYEITWVSYVNSETIVWFEPLNYELAEEEFVNCMDEDQKKEWKNMAYDNDWIEIDKKPESGFPSYH